MFEGAGQRSEHFRCKEDSNNCCEKTMCAKTQHKHYHTMHALPLAVYLLEGAGSRRPTERAQHRRDKPDSRQIHLNEQQHTVVAARQEETVGGTYVTTNDGGTGEVSNRIDVPKKRRGEPRANKGGEFSADEREKQKVYIIVQKKRGTVDHTSSPSGRYNGMPIDGASRTYAQGIIPTTTMHCT